MGELTSVSPLVAGSLPRPVATSLEKGSSKDTSQAPPAFQGFLGISTSLDPRDRVEDPSSQRTFEQIRAQCLDFQGRKPFPACNMSSYQSFTFLNMNIHTQAPSAPWRVSLLQGQGQIDPLCSRSAPPSRARSCARARLLGARHQLRVRLERRTRAAGAAGVPCRAGRGLANHPPRLFEAPMKSPELGGGPNQRVKLGVQTPKLPTQNPTERNCLRLEIRHKTPMQTFSGDRRSRRGNFGSGNLTNNK